MLHAVAVALLPLSPTPEPALVAVAPAPSVRQEPGRRGRPKKSAEPEKEKEPQPLNEAQTRSRVVQYERGEHWALRGLVLTSLGHSWHPQASSIVLDALSSKDERLRAYGLERLARTEPGALRAVMTTELVDHLVRKTLRESEEHWQARAGVVLAATFPDAGATTKKDWERHWYALDKTYTPTEWKAPIVEHDGMSVAASPVERALDLYEAGLDVVICIDSTGSMQPTIDTAASAIDDLVHVLSGVAPQFRLGLVHYKDYDDLHAGAVALEPLDKRHDRVRDRLASLTAAGGGDFPERVECGLEIALDPREMKWRRETNKLIVVIGDAPPHDDALSDAVGLARDAFEMPFGKPATPVEARKRDGRSRSKPTRPFVTACIGVGPRGVGDATRSAFQEIADAGGGTYGELTAFGEIDAGDQLVGHVLKLSFGAQYAEHLDEFVEVFLEYHRHELFE